MPFCGKAASDSFSEVDAGRKPLIRDDSWEKTVYEKTTHKNSDAPAKYSNGGVDLCLLAQRAGQ